MHNEREAPPADALADIAYLSRSGNRLHVLELVAAEPHTPRELRGAVDASQSTIRRILAELVDRGWVERTTNGHVEVTMTGEHVVTAFSPVVGSMEAVEELGDALSWLPSDELSIGLHHFSDATVRRGNPNSPVAEASYLHEQLRDATTFTNLASIGPPLSMMETTRDGVVSGRLTATTVITRDLLDYLRTQPEQVPLWQRYIAAGAQVHCYDGAIPCNLHVVDDTLLLGNNRPGRPCEFIETDDETVLTWARSTIESYRTDADRLEVDAFAAPPSASPGQSR
jgi:predicted transcriptional regulator